MNKQLFFFVLLLPLTSLAQERFVIRGRIAHLNAPAKVFLHYMLPTEWATDSAVLVDGAFEFKGEIGFPMEAMLVLRRNGGGLFQSGGWEEKSLYLEDGTITVTAPDSLPGGVITGGPVNRDLLEFEAMMRPYREHSRELGKNYMNTTPEQRKTQTFKDSLKESYLRLQTEEREIYARFIRQYPGSPIGLNLLRYRYGHLPPVDVIAPLYDLLSPEVKNTKAGKEYGDLVALWVRTNVGQTAPDFVQKDPTYKPVSLYDLRGKYVLLNFWATWCGPCIQEKPGLRKVYARYKDKGFEILDVSMTDKTHQFGDRDKWLKKINDMQLTWKNVYGDEAVELYGIQTVPQNFLIDPQGKIIAKNVYGEVLNNKMASLLQ